MARSTVDEPDELLHEEGLCVAHVKIAEDGLDFTKLTQGTNFVVSPCFGMIFLMVLRWDRDQTWQKG